MPGVEVRSACIIVVCVDLGLVDRIRYTRVTYTSWDQSYKEMQKKDIAVSVKVRREKGKR